MSLLLLPAVYLLAAMIWLGLLFGRRQGLGRGAEGPGALRYVPLGATALGALLCVPLILSGPQRLTLVRWTPVDAFGGDLLLYSDPLSVLFAVLLALLAAAAALAERRTVDDDAPLTVMAALLLTAAALGFVLAGNLLTLTAAWLFMDLATLAAPRWLHTTQTAPVRVQALALNYLGGLLIFLAGIAALSQNPALTGQPWTAGALASLSLPLLEAGFSINPALLLALAAYVRLGAYPFHRNVPDAGSTPLAAWLRLTPFAVGTYLLARAASLALDAPLAGPGWTLAIGAATLAAALLAWLATTQEDALRWLAVYAATGLLLGVTAGPTEVGLLIVLGGVALVLAVGALALAAPLRPSSATRRWVYRWIQAIRAIATLTLWGAPLTLGFVYRWGTYRAGLEAGAIQALTWAVLAAAFASASLWTLALTLLRESPAATSGAKEPQLLELVGLTLLGAPLLILGLQPLLITPALDLVSAPGASSRIADLVRGTPTATGIQIALLMLMPWLVGLGLSYVRRRVPATAPLGQSLRSWLRLDWLNTRRWRPLSFTIRLLRLITGLGEGERYVGLLAVFAVIIALALLQQ